MTIFLFYLSSQGEGKLHENSIRHQRLPLHSRNPRNLLVSYFAIKKLLRTESFDLIHAHARIPAVLISHIAKKQGIPLVTTVHAQFRTTPLLRRFSRWGDFSIAVSEDLRQYLCEQYALSSARIEVIPNGIDASHFVPTNETHAFKPRRIVFVSRLDKDCSKVAFLLCQIAPVLRKKFPNLEIVLGGGGDCLPELRRLAERINQAYETPLLLLPGHLSDPRELYLSAECVVGVSRVAMEAALCELPVLLAGNEGFLGLLTPETLRRALLSNFCCRGAPSVSESLLLHSLLEILNFSLQERDKLTEETAQALRSQVSIQAVVQKTLCVYRQLCREFSDPKSKSLLFCGYYGYGNLGDHALLRAAIARARAEHPDTSLCAMTAHGKRDEPKFGIRCIKRWHLIALLKHIRKADLFVFGGGTLLQDRTSLRSLLYYAFLLRYAARHGVRCELWANGISEPRSRLAKALIRKALCSCRSIGLRDTVSLTLARELCADKPMHSIVFEKDLALSTQSADEDRIRFLLDRFGLLNEDGSIQSFAVAIPRGREDAGQIRIFCWWLARLRAKGIRLVFVPMFPKEDRALCRRLAKELGGGIALGCSEQDLVGLMHFTEVVASMRLHGLVFAAVAKSSFVGFGADPKIKSFCKENGGHEWTELL